MALLPELKLAVTGPDEMMVAGLAMGSDGAIGSTYNIYPKTAVRLYNAFRSGDILVRVCSARGCRLKGLLPTAKNLTGWQKT